MAPSPTSPAEDETGFHIVEFNWDGEPFMYACQAYIWNGHGGTVLYRFTLKNNEI
jgi:hypothetical protein